MNVITRSDVLDRRHVMVDTVGTLISAKVLVQYVNVLVLLFVFCFLFCLVLFCCFVLFCFVLFCFLFSFVLFCFVFCIKTIRLIFDS